MKSQTQTILISGATGFIGSRLATLALQRGYAVRTLTRCDWTTLPAVPIEQRYFGALPAQIPAAAVQGADVVVHCAAQMEANERSSYAVNVEGSLRLARMAASAGVRTFIFLSSQSARPDALSPYGRTKYAAEQRLLELDGALNVIVLRPGVVTGPGSRGLFQRMRRMVETLPVIPILGGERARVQPIHVDDLSEAIFRCAERGDELRQSVFKLADNDGFSLAEFLQTIAVDRLGHRKKMISIPLRPIEATVQLAERLGVPLPINANNLQGLKRLERMETSADLARLGLELRPPLESAVPDEPDLPLEKRAVRVLLIGTGRVGLVHAVTLWRLNGMQLCGLVDSNIKAARLFQGMGIDAPAFQSVERALSSVRPDAAVIATPVASHLALAQTCLKRGLTVMIEKPLTLGPRQFADYEKLAREFPTQPIQVGYVMARNPQIASYLERLKAGDFGTVRGFVGITLNSFVHEDVGDRWQVQKDNAGGGVFTNFGSHVLSMIWTAFGDPLAVTAQSAKLFSKQVEDSVVAKFDYEGFSGTHYCSWSIRGYPRQENKLVVLTDRGQLIVTGSVGVFVSADDLEMVHQLDFDLGFNIAPDYAGGGFTAELNDLKKATITRRPQQITLETALQVERLLFSVYEVAREVSTFSAPDAGFATLARRSVAPSDQPLPPRILDLRELSLDAVQNYFQTPAKTSTWAGHLLMPTQMQRVPQPWASSEHLRVTVPDFLYLARLLSTKEYTAVLRLMGWRGVLSAGLAVPPVALRERGPSFWVGAAGLLAAGLQGTAPEFTGTLLLHPYLTDFALSLRRLDLLDHMLAMCRRTRRRARVGFHTNMPAEALNALWQLETRVDDVSVLSSPDGVNLSATFDEMRQASGHSELRITAEVGLAPFIVHQQAFDAPHRWVHGADAILIGPGADSAVAAHRKLEMEREWDQAFPGLPMPEHIL